MTKARFIFAAIAAALIIGLVILGPAACNRYLAEKKAGQIERGQHGATLDSMDEANKTNAEIEKEADKVRAEAKGLADEVRDAPAGDSNDAADRAVCRLRAYRDTQRCAAMRAADTPVAP